MNNANDKSFGGPMGLCRQMTQTVMGLIESAAKLKNALICKDREGVWGCLSEHQDRINRLERLAELWRDIADAVPQEGAFLEARNELRGNVDKLRSMERVNARLANSFLGAIGKFFSNIGMGVAKEDALYNRRGRVSARSPAMLLNRVG